MALVAANAIVQGETVGLHMRLEDPKATFKVGDSFETFSEVEKKVAEYEASHYVKFWKRDAITIEAARVDRYLNPRLKYYQLKCACTHGDQAFRGKGDGHRNTL